MKKFLMILICLIIPSKVFALSTSDALSEIDINKDCSVNLYYYYDDYDFNDVNVDIYYIASLTKDFKYQLSSSFKDYSINVNGIKNDSEWNILEQTIDSYIEVDKIEKIQSKKILNNKVSFSDLKPGLYFIKTDLIDSREYTLSFDSFLINFPSLDEDGIWNYEFEVYPKAESYIPKYNDIKYKVIKEWIDNGTNRPNNIDVEIYKNDTYIETIVLSNDNNWTYEWITKDDGSNWNVIERIVPNGYNVSIKKENNNFILVNTMEEEDEIPPQTSDNIKIYFYFLTISLIGIILLIVSLFIEKKNEN